MAAMLAAWLVWASPVLPVPKDDGTLANAWVLGPSVFAIDTVIVLPLSLALLYALRRNRRLTRAWDATTFAVGAISVIDGAWGLCVSWRVSLDNPGPVAQEYPLFFFALPMFVAGTIATFGSYRMLKSARVP
jgi:ABC-type sulfate transport system permease component